MAFKRKALLMPAGLAGRTNIMDKLAEERKWWSEEMVPWVKHLLFKCMDLNLNPQNHIVHLSNPSPPVLKLENLQKSWVSGKSRDLDSSKVEKETAPETVLCPLCRLWPPSSYHGNIHSPLPPATHTYQRIYFFLIKRWEVLGSELLVGFISSVTNGTGS